MRTHDELERLAAAGQPLLLGADSLVDAAEEDRILQRILGSERQAAVVHRRRRAVLVLAAAAVVAAAIAVVATGALSGASKPGANTGGPHHIALTGPRIEVAGYHFRTPAGFTRSSSSCAAASAAGQPTTVLNGFAAAASADGGCVEAAFLIRAGAHPNGAVPIDVGQYQGYYVSPDSSGESALYIELPNATGDGQSAYLGLFAQGLREDQLIAVAVSGLPAAPTSN